VFEWIGWIATAVFAVSYFCKQPTTLRRLQAVAALMWIGYGLIIGAAPVVAANSVVAVLAVYSSTRRQRSEVVKTGPEEV
jgi:Bacterial inner membrane protein